MAFNPFLSMGDPVADANTDTSNPFMFDSGETVDYSAENPFATSNPFADVGEVSYDQQVPDANAFNIFGLSTTDEANKVFQSQTNEDEFNSFQMKKPSDLSLTTSLIDHKEGSDQETKPKRPPPPPRPVPTETQNLILSVTGQMDVTSSHLLDRIPPTRTPSPVSMRDLHSPLPDEDLLMDDSIPLDSNKSSESNFQSSMEVQPEPVAVPEEVKPVRPAQAPPPRPPPARPGPPPVPAPPTVQTYAQNVLQPNKEVEVNLFDPPSRISPPKPKEEILSLYNQSQEEKPVDFLSDDINELTQNPPKQTENENPFEHTKTELSSVSQSYVSTRNNSFTNETHKESMFQKDTFGNTCDQNDSVFSSKPESPKNPFETMDTSATEHITTSISGQQYEVPEDASFPISDHEYQVTEKDHAQEEVHPSAFAQQQDEFDAFSAKFESTSNRMTSMNAWGDGKTNDPVAEDAGFDADEGGFDAFLSMTVAPPVTPAFRSKNDSIDSDEENNFSITIKPSAKQGDQLFGGAVPALAPPPKPTAFTDHAQINPFAVQTPFASANEPQQVFEDQSRKQSGSETPSTPLFDEDVSVPLEEFPRVVYIGPGWEMQLRQPNKKKITGQRFWKKIFVKLAYQGDNPVVQLFNTPTDKEPFQELPLQACYSVSDISAQQYDQYGKIFTVKLQYIFYKERPGVRPGQVTKAERITNKLSQFAAYAIQGDYQGVKEFGSDLKKLGLPVEHAPQISQLFKIGSLNYDDVKQFSVTIEEALFKIPVHRDRALQYKLEEVQITAVDELYAEQNHEGSVTKQIARVRLFFLGFLCGMPDVEVGVNDMRRQGKEVVGRHDIIPVATEEWIRVENAEFHACVQSEEFLKTQILRFKPPDACYVELLRFRIRPPKNRELPLQLKAVMCVTGNKVELRADVLVPGFTSRKLGQIPCEDVSIRFPIPECWIYLFRVEKHFRYGSVKSAHRRTGKIKGIERLLGAVDTLQESLIEVTSGQAKYEHQHRAIVWRMSRLPKEGQGAYTTHNLVCRMALTSYDQIPPELSKYAYVEFTMPHTQVSHMTVRSVSLQNHDSDEPPEKYVRYLARHEYVVGIEHTRGSAQAAYMAAAAVPSSPEPVAVPPTVAEQSSESDSD